MTRILPCILLAFAVACSNDPSRAEDAGEAGEAGGIDPARLGEDGEDCETFLDCKSGVCHDQVCGLPDQGGQGAGPGAEGEDAGPGEGEDDGEEGGEGDGGEGEGEGGDDGGPRCSQEGDSCRRTSECCEDLNCRDESCVSVDGNEEGGEVDDDELFVPRKGYAINKTAE